METSHLHSNGRGQEWPPVMPTGTAQDIAKKQLYTYMKKYLRQNVNDGNPEHQAGIRLLQEKHIGAVVGYDIDARKLNVILYYCIKVRRKTDALDIREIDNHMTPKAAAKIINTMDPLDLPVIADALICEYLDVLKDDERNPAIMVEDEPLSQKEIWAVKRHLYSLDSELRQLHAQIKNASLHD